MPQGVDQPAGTLVGLDAVRRRSAHPHGQQPLGTALAWTGPGAQELLRFGGPVEWSPSRHAVFALGHLEAAADQSPPLAPVVSGLLRQRGRRSARGHSTVLALEPIAAEARRTEHGDEARST